VAHEFKASPGKKVVRSHLNQKTGHGGIHLSSQPWGKVNRRISVLTNPSINMRPYSKNNYSKKGRTSLKQYLPRKPEAIS
jgi:hypothetical protein